MLIDPSIHLPLQSLLELLLASSLTHYYMQLEDHFGIDKLPYKYRSVMDDCKKHLLYSASHCVLICFLAITFVFWLQMTLDLQGRYS